MRYTKDKELHFVDEAMRVIENKIEFLTLFKEMLEIMKDLGMHHLLNEEITRNYFDELFKRI